MAGLVVLSAWAASSAACHGLAVRPPFPPRRHGLQQRSQQLAAPASLGFPPPAGSARTVSAPFVVQPLASRVCDLTGKRANNGYKVSFSHHRTKKLQNVNLQRKRLWWEEGKRFVKLRVSTKALRTIEKKGLSAVAKKAGIDLNKH